MPPNARTWIVKIWHQSSMNVFAKEVLLPLSVVVIGLLIFTNPMNFDWTQRLTGAACILFGAYFVAHTVQKVNKTGSTTPAKVSVLAAESPSANAGQKLEQSVTGRPALPARVFLPPDIDFEYLTSIYRERTWLQADSLAKDYIGKWMKHSAFVENVVERPTFNNRLEFHVLATLEQHPKRFAVETLKFGEAWKDRVAVLKLGSKITFVGKIEGIDSSSITLRDCELVD